jgi:CRISPR/Cas system-associated exonuclease Cas4 (RecB family)
LQKAKAKQEDAAPCQTTLPYFSHTFTQYNTSETSENQRIGNVLHQILQYIVQATDLDKAIEKACRMGIILPNEKSWAQAEMTKLLSHPGTKTWFDGTYPTVWNERSIITSYTQQNQTGKYRPDRLLVKDNQIVVVDYKFGKENNNHHTQMHRYMQSLCDMNQWKYIKGYLYYHQDGSIKEVTL